MTGYYAALLIGSIVLIFLTRNSDGFAFRRPESGGSIISRREVSSSILFPAAIAGSVLLPLPKTASALDLPFIGSASDNKRQLELCLVTVLRVKNWALGVANAIDEMLQNAPPSGPSDLQKAPYLECRLGCKALLTGRVGGGANSKVYTLAGLQIKECLKDAEYWLRISEQNKSGDKKQRNAAMREYAAASEAIVESLAACVEFDGLETTLDPSPRSSLMLGQYTNQKALFLKRMLRERVVPNCDALLACFDSAAKERSLRYLLDNYSNEIPPPPPRSPSVLVGVAEKTAEVESSASTSAS